MLIPTTIAAFTGDRHRGNGPADKKNVIAMSGRAVEAAGDVDVLLLDKTGTIPWGTRRKAVEFIPVREATAPELRRLPGSVAWRMKHRRDAVSFF